MNTIHQIDTIYPHSRNAAHGVEVPAGARLLFTNGQTGSHPDGVTPDSIEEQTVIVFERLRTILAAANMAFDDVVRLNAYLTDAAYTQVFLDVRDAMLGDHKPAATFVIVSALVRPELKIEIEAVAAKVD